MKTTVEYLDTVKKKLGIDSDYAAAKALHVTRSGISKYRLGRTYFDDTTALRVARILDIDPLEVIAAANIERARDSETRSLWESAWGKVTGAAVATAVAGCFIGLSTAPSPANAAEFDNGATVYIM